MADVNHRKEVLEEVERLGIFPAIDAAESLLARVRREAGNGKNGSMRDAVSAPEDAALAAWAKDYVTWEEGKRVSALMDVRLRAVLDPLVTSMAQSTASFVHERIAEATAPLIARIAELEAGAVKYQGVWSAEKTYRGADFVTHQGGLWYAESASIGERPGSESSSWTLANKSRR